MDDPHFQTFLPHRTSFPHLHAHHCGRSCSACLAQYADFFVPYTSQQGSGTMASALHQSSFFADEMHHHQREQCTFEEPHSQPGVLRQFTQPYAIRPLAPTANTAMVTRVSPASLVGMESSILAVPGVLGCHVDEAQYEYVHERDWLRASVGYGAASLGPVVSTSPLTSAPDYCGLLEEYNIGSGQYKPDFVAGTYNSEALDSEVAPPILPFSISSTSSQIDAQASSSAGYPDGLPLVAFDRYKCAAMDTGKSVQQGIGKERPPSASGRLLPATTHARDHIPLSDSLEHGLPPVEDDMSVFQIEETEPEDSGSEAPGRTATLSDRELNKALLRMRNANISYKEIKHRLGFHEAESTLRGRFRTLTKHKSERVRRPKWTPEDAKLLRRAVRRFSQKVRTSRAKVPWTMVSIWMRENGSTYNFAPATCAKKWDEING